MTPTDLEGIRIAKLFPGWGNGLFFGTITEVNDDGRSEPYWIEYDDEDVETMTSQQVQEALKCYEKYKAEDKKSTQTRKKARVSPTASPPLPLSSSSTTTTTTTSSTTTTTSRFGRVRKQLRQSVADDAYDFDSGASDDDDDEEEDVPPSKRRSSRSRPSTNKKKRPNPSNDDNDESVADDAYDFDSAASDDDEEEDVPPPKGRSSRSRPSAKKKKRPNPSSSRDSDDDSDDNDGNSGGGGGDGGKKTMAESFKPKDAPPYHTMSLQEIWKNHECLDPCGIEATDSIIEGIIGEQIDKIGSLLARALRSKDCDLGSASYPLKIATACSGTDAPVLSLTILKEQMDLRKNLLGIPKDKDATSLLHTEHVFSCEIDAFKQAYIARNFDAHLYPNISNLCDENPCDAWGRPVPLGDFNLSVMGTSCKNFSTQMTKHRIDIEDKGCSGETFLAAVELLFKKKPRYTLFENVEKAPWEKV